nr:hypothetical protein [Tanacetum cinerariifolium]
MTTDKDGNLKIRPPVTAEEHQQKFKEFKISKEEGLDKGYDKVQKILSQMNTLKIKPEPEDVNIKFLRGLPPSWSSIALILKTKGGLEYISFDDLYNKLKFLEIDTKGYSSSSSTLSNATFRNTAGSSQGKLSYQELGNDGYGGYTTTHSASPGSSSSKDLDQMNKEEFEEYDLKHQMAMLSIKKMGHFSKECRAQGGQNSNNYQKYKEAGKDGTDSKAMVVVYGSVDWDKQTEEGNPKPRSLEIFGMLAGIKLESDVDSEGEVVYVDDVIPAVVSVSTGLVAAADSLHFETEFAFMGLSIEGEYDIWAMKMQNFISSSDLLCWNIVLKGNSAKSMTTDKDANQALEIGRLMKRVKKLEKRANKKTHKLKRLYKIGFSPRVKSSKDAGLGDQEDASKQGRMIKDLNADEGVALVDETEGRNDQDMFDTSILDDEEAVAKKEVSTADLVPVAGEVVTTAGVKIITAAITSQISTDEITLAKALIDIKASKPKAKGIAKDKGKAKMIEPEKPLKKKDQIMIDEEVTKNIEAQMQAELEKEERLARQKIKNQSLFGIHNLIFEVGKSIKAFEDMIENESHFVAKVIKNHSGPLTMLTKGLMRER